MSMRVNIERMVQGALQANAGTWNQITKQLAGAQAINASMVLKKIKAGRDILVGQTATGQIVTMSKSNKVIYVNPQGQPYGMPVIPVTEIRNGEVRTSYQPMASNIGEALSMGIAQILSYIPLFIIILIVIAVIWYFLRKRKKR